MTAKYFANSAKYQITLNRKEAEALAYYGSSYDLPDHRSEAVER